MSGVFVVQGDDQHLAALLDIADADRQMDYLEAELHRARGREWGIALISAIGWLWVVFQNWGSVCRLAGALVDMAGRTLGGTI